MISQDQIFEKDSVLTENMVFFKRLSQSKSTQNANKRYNVV
jgi:hypothetical protein